MLLTVTAMGPGLFWSSCTLWWVWTLFPNYRDGVEIVRPRPFRVITTRAISLSMSSGSSASASRSLSGQTA